MKPYIDVFPQLQWIYLNRWAKTKGMRPMKDEEVFKFLQKYRDNLLESVDWSSYPILDYLKKKHLINRKS